MAKIISNGEKWIPKLDVGANESKVKFSQIICK